jgi:phosphoribosylglycinamide formyltransferase-1
VSDKADAGGLDLAREAGIAAVVVAPGDFDDRAAWNEAVAQAVDVFRPDLVVLAGFMRILMPAFVQRYEGRLINIHPSLLPAFPGLHTHQRAIDAGCRFAGVTVHQVTAELDYGPILDQAVVPVLATDTADALAARVLTQEHLIYPRAIAALLPSL